MIEISSLIREDREFLEYETALHSRMLGRCEYPIAVNGLSGGAEDAFVIESIRSAYLAGAPSVLVLVANDSERERVVGTLLSSGIDARAFKLREPVYYNISASHEIDRERLSVLSALLSGERIAVVATAAAALSYTVPRALLAERALTLRTGGEISPVSLAERLSAMGFLFVDAVEERGQFSRRGGILDFWGEDSDSPVRVEFFGDEIDRMVLFDPLTQRSVSGIDTVRLLPAREVIADAPARERVAACIERLLRVGNLPEQSRAKLARERESVRSGSSIDFADKYIGKIYEERECLFDYLYEPKTSVFILGTSAVRESYERAASRAAEQINSLLAEGVAVAEDARFFASRSDYDAALRRLPTVHINAFSGTSPGERLSGLFGFRTRRCTGYGESVSILFEDILAYRKAKFAVILLSSNRQGALSIIETLSEYGVSAVGIFDNESFSASSLVRGSVYVSIGEELGFELIAPSIAVLSLREDKVSTENAKKRARRNRRILRSNSQQIMSHAELSVGDYVVHANYGIGLFEGIEAVTVDGVTRDYITIKYAGTDKLFVPCETLDAIGKYIGERDKDGGVKLSRMGGAEWHRAKSRAKAAAKNIARELIEIYARRQRTPGFAFPENRELTDEFDSQFEYAETDSQLQAIEEIRRDMMRPTPMQRLLCGDVGFGKTEVALRAAFMAVLAGKQVALLVPTTILALQHYETTKARMRGYAVNIEMLSRLTTPKQRENILARLRRGEIDILIGTHSLLSRKLEFSDLGLLLIDEEQRFGVVQKERLREMSTNVDTLMLSATPIPRTLNMAMSGINDISVLDEAPGERRPVQSYVLEHDDAIINDALSRELMRGGQALYLYNKIDGIELVADRILRALPEARVATAHGQMDRDELEDIWRSLVRGEIDILVCTTIIETGVDLPNANTLVIENADRFGLSQLHQIRGRVGRSKRQAYAYFTYRPGKALSEVAEKRLSAIREYAEFGAGFKIALCDLEIRGAGNLLGEEQHGHIESVGYDLYIKLLNEAVLEEKNEGTTPREEAQITLGVSANIPESYIPSLPQRMEMYKKIASLRLPEDYSDLADEFIDRFGDMPRTVSRLLSVSLSRALATRLGIKKIEHTRGRVVFVTEKPDLAVWSELFARYRALSFMGASTPSVAYRLEPGDEPSEIMRAVMNAYYEIATEEEENERD